MILGNFIFNKTFLRFTFDFGRSLVWTVIVERCVEQTTALRSPVCIMSGTDEAHKSYWWSSVSPNDDNKANGSYGNIVGFTLFWKEDAREGEGWTGIENSTIIELTSTNEITTSFNDIQHLKTVYIDVKNHGNYLLSNFLLICTLFQTFFFFLFIRCYY